MYLLKTTVRASLIIFVTVISVSVLCGFGIAEAFQPQPEPPGVFMPTLTPDDALRVNVAYVTNKSKMKSARCLILVRTLLSGEVIVENEVVLESGEGMSMDISYAELLRLGVDDSQLVGLRNDLPLRVQVQSDQRRKIFVGFEIHEAIITATRTYIPGGAEPLNYPQDMIERE
jgi:hypothetical protein